MFRLTREVRFAVNDSPDGQLNHPPTNSYGGYPSLTGLGRFFALQVTLAGDLDPASQYVINIKQIDDAVRSELEEVQRILADPKSSALNNVAWAPRPRKISSVNVGEAPTPQIFQRLQSPVTPAKLTMFFHERLLSRFGDRLERVTLLLSPYLTMSIFRSEFPMIRLSQKFEFSASHRLHNPNLSEAENRTCFGKCNNPHGHGHNYELQVTLRGEPNEKGLLIDVPDFERIVGQSVVARFDHKNLNQEVAEFAAGDLIPTVENIARVIYRSLKPEFGRSSATLASVTVWETPKTWCEYQE